MDSTIIGKKQMAVKFLKNSARFMIRGADGFELLTITTNQTNPIINKQKMIGSPHVFTNLEFLIYDFFPPNISLLNTSSYWSKKYFSLSFEHLKKSKQILRNIGGKNWWKHVVNRSQKLILIA